MDPKIQAFNAAVALLVKRKKDGEICAEEFETLRAQAQFDILGIGRDIEAEREEAEKKAAFFGGTFKGKKPWQVKAPPNPLLAGVRQTPIAAIPRLTVKVGEDRVLLSEKAQQAAIAKAKAPGLSPETVIPFDRYGEHMAGKIIPATGPTLFDPKAREKEIQAHVASRYQAGEFGPIGTDSEKKAAREKAAAEFARLKNEQITEPSFVREADNHVAKAPIFGASSPGYDLVRAVCLNEDPFASKWEARTSYPEIPTQRDYKPEGDVIITFVRLDAIQIGMNVTTATRAYAQILVPHHEKPGEFVYIPVPTEKTAGEATVTATAQDVIRKIEGVLRASSLHSHATVNSGVILTLDMPNGDSTKPRRFYFADIPAADGKPAQSARAQALAAALAAATPDCGREDCKKCAKKLAGTTRDGCGGWEKSIIMTCPICKGKGGHTSRAGKMCKGRSYLPVRFRIPEVEPCPKCNGKCIERGNLVFSCQRCENTGIQNHYWIRDTITRREILGSLPVETRIFTMNPGTGDKELAQAAAKGVSRPPCRICQGSRVFKGEICPACKGESTQVDDLGTCGNCHGDGRVPDPDRTMCAKCKADPENPERRLCKCKTALCFVCNGSGKYALAKRAAREGMPVAFGGPFMEDHSAARVYPRTIVTATGNHVVPKHTRAQDPVGSKGRVKGSRWYTGAPGSKPRATVKP